MGVPDSRATWRPEWASGVSTRRQVTLLEARILPPTVAMVSLMKGSSGLEVSKSAAKSVWLGALSGGGRGCGGMASLAQER